ncbi:MAG: hypothetical protein ACC662_06135, partial [Planctomycetota bacterium]
MNGAGSSPAERSLRCPPDLASQEVEALSWIERLEAVEAPPPVPGAAILAAWTRAAWTRADRGPWRLLPWLASAAAVLVAGFALAGFSRAAERAAADGCDGALCRERVLAVVDDPSLPLYHTMETFSVLDDDGDMDDSQKGDGDSDCYVVDYGCDGTVDRMVDYIDTDGDQIPNEMDIRYFIDGELRRSWMGLDLDGDGEMWDLVDYEYTGNFFASDPYDDNMIYM